MVRRPRPMDQGQLPMGYGDEIIGSGLAKGAADRGALIAFGDQRRRRIAWHHTHAHHIFDGNPNVARPGWERYGSALEWIPHYPGTRVYARLFPGRRQWDFIPGTLKGPGEIYFHGNELKAADDMLAGLDLSRLVIMEPNTKNMAPNKRWGLTRYTYVADRLRKAGFEIGQFRLPIDSYQQRIPTSGGHYFPTPTFKVACAILSRARLYVGPEGGLHHAAAALGVPAVVIFGGYISPSVTGYAAHRNYFIGDDLGCGRF